MNTILRGFTKLLIIVIFTSSLLSSGLAQTKAEEVEDSPKTFIIYQLQTASPTSASSEFISVINASNKPMRLGGLCLMYSAASSDNWLQRACFSGPDEYVQLWVVAGGVVYVATDQFTTENTSFIPDGVLSGAMAASGGAVRLEQAGVVLDMLGWGNSNAFEGVVALAPANNEMLERSVAENKIVDSEDNALDFMVAPQGFTAQSGVFEVEIPKDICSNIEGLQETLPIGFIEEAGSCFEDLCLNIDGLQKISDGYEIDELGSCAEVELEDSDLMITELLPNVSGVDDGNEFIEIYNLNNFSVNLGGYVLSSESKTHVLESYDLAPNSYVFYKDDQTNIVLPNSSGVEVVLTAPSGREVSRSELYANAPDDQSWSLFSNTWQFSNQPSPGAENKLSKDASIGGESTSDPTLAPCPEGKFRNPLTNRCKNIDSGSTLTPCGANEYRNPATNRCNKLSSSTSSLTPCKAGQERNPTTNRCRSISSSTSALQPCAEGKERNPETNRCRTVAVLSSSDGGSTPALTATIVDVPAPSTGVNWVIISAAIIGSFAYILYEWRVELARTVATLRSYRYN